MDPLYFFFFNDTATTEIYTLSLHDALPILSRLVGPARAMPARVTCCRDRTAPSCERDRKSTRLNSSHLVISYAVFCLKKKKRGTFAATAKMNSFACLANHAAGPSWATPRY